MSRAYKQSHLYSTQLVTNAAKITAGGAAGSFWRISRQKHPFCTRLIILLIFVVFAEVSTVDGKNKKQKTDSLGMLAYPI